MKIQVLGANVQIPCLVRNIYISNPQSRLEVPEAQIAEWSLHFVIYSDYNA